MLKIALNQNTCKNLGLIEFIHFSKDFYGVELDHEKINECIAKRSTIQDIIELLDSCELSLLSIFSLENFSLCSETHYKLKILPKMSLMMDYLYKLESDLIVVTPSQFENSEDSSLIPKWRIFNRTRKRLKEISNIAYKNDINIGFEFENHPNSSISTLSDAKQVFEELEEVENLGFVIDLFHLYKSNDTFRNLADIKEKLSLIQLCDVNYSEKNGIKSRTELERLMPGEGAIEFQDMFDFFRKLRYRNIYSIELSEHHCQDKNTEISLNYLKKLNQRNYEFQD